MPHIHFVGIQAGGLHAGKKTEAGRKWGDENNIATVVVVDLPKTRFFQVFGGQSDVLRECGVQGIPRVRPG